MDMMAEMRENVTGAHPLLDDSMLVLHHSLLHGRVDHQLIQLQPGAHTQADE